jgi:Lrp/AsnC family transcriptional regulator, leucine-responsive regulatory protein
MFDNFDKTILTELQQNARISNVELARRVKLSAPATLARVRRLEENGYVCRHSTIVDRRKAGYDMLCFVSVSMQLHEIKQVTGFFQTIQEMPEVLECHHVTGNYDYLLKVVAKNTADLEDFLINRLTPIKGVARIHTSLVLRETKNTTVIPLK